MILVGVANTERYRDNLPFQRDGSPGGADKFLRFFAEELIPFIDEELSQQGFSNIGRTTGRPYAGL